MADSTPTSQRQPIQVDTSIRPQDDFYHYVNQLFVNNHPLPQDREVVSQYTLLQGKVDRRIEQMIAEWRQLDSAHLTLAQQQVVELAQLYIDQDRLAGQSLQALEEIYEQAYRALDQTGLAGLLGVLSRLGVGWGVVPKAHLQLTDTRYYRLCLHGGDGVLPTKGHYVNQNWPHFQRIRGHYQDFIRSYSQRFLETVETITRSTRFTGEVTTIVREWSDHQDLSQFVLDLETRLAESDWSPASIRARHRSYRLYSRSQLQANFAFDWRAYFKGVGRKCPDQVLVFKPSYLAASLQLFSQLPAQRLRRYLAWRLAVSYADLISTELSRHKFAFFGRVLGGQVQEPSLHTRLCQFVQTHLPDTVGQEYVQRHYQLEQQADLEKMATQIRRSLQYRLAHASWLSPGARRYARTKLDQVVVNLGVPSTWADYSSLGRDWGNLVSARSAIDSLRQNLIWERVDQVADRRNFPGEKVIRVNAWADHGNMCIICTAAILQPPFYDHLADPLTNLGLIGTTIGHEWTHHFDKMGCRHDHLGNLNSWMPVRDQDRFIAACQPLLDQASRFQVTEGVYMRGPQVISEALADLGGVQTVIDIVTRQYRQHQERQRAWRQVFIAYAYKRFMNMSLEARINRAVSSYHPDVLFRVNGVLAHIQEFYEAFDVRPGDRLYLPPDHRCRVWSGGGRPLSG